MKARLLIVLFLLLCVTPAHATVNEVFARNDYVGNASTTSFPYTFRIINQADVMVLLNSVLQTLNVEYTVLGVDNPGGGAIVFATAPPAGQKVALLRAQRFQQLSIYTPNEAFPAKRIESDLDKNSMVDQRQEEEIGRALKFDPYSLYRNVFVDDPIAGNCLVWNASLTRVASTPCAAGGGGIPGDLTGAGTAGQVTFWTGPAALAGDGKFLWDNSTKALTVGTTPLGPLKPGNVFIGLQAPSNNTGMQTLMVQTHQGAPGLAGLVTLGDDRVGVSSWNFRGTGANNPIYGANFGVVFNTDGVANGVEIDVQNMTTTPNSGQALWLNGSGVGERSNAILIDTQDATKWQRGILFKEGFVGNGATGSISGMGIHFERSQDADFIVIQPRVGAAGNVAMKVSNPAFTLNRFELLNSGTLRVSNSMTGPAFPSYSFIEGAGPTAGMYLETVGIAATPPGPGGVPPAVPASGGVLGWSVNSLRRLTLGDALNIWNAGAGANQGGTINFFDPTAVHSVGLMAPDFVGNSFRMKLPTVPGFTGQCLITDAGFPISQLSFAACGTGGGGGGSGTVTNTGVLGLNQLVLGDGGVAIKGMGTLGTATTVLHGNPSGPPIFAGIGPLDLSATGTASSATFLRGDWTWATPSGSGTVTTSGSPAANQVPFYTAPTVISGDAGFAWNNSTKSLVVSGLGQLTGNYNPLTGNQGAAIGLLDTGSSAGSGGVVILGSATGQFAAIKGLLTNGTPVTPVGDLSISLRKTVSDSAFTERLKIESTGLTTLSGQVLVQPAIDAPAQNSIFVNTTVSATTGTFNGLFLRANTSGQMSDSFGPSIGFAALDADLVHQSAGQLYFTRSGADNTYRFGLATTVGGVLAERIFVDTGGTVNTTGSLRVESGLVVNGTAAPGSIAASFKGVYTGLEPFGSSAGQGGTFYWRAPLTGSVVGLKAPDSVPGNFIWTLPSTYGAAGSVLTHLDGVGTLGWSSGASVTTTGTPAANQFAFFSGTNTITSNAAFSFNAGTGVVSLSPPGSLQIGGVPAGSQAQGPMYTTIITSDNTNPYQGVLAQIVNGSTAGVGPSTILNDKVAITGDAFRGAGGTSPIYGAHFAVTFATTGVANAIEIGVQNNSGTNNIGQGLWINAAGSNHRSNAILIDTQNSTKWDAGIRFLEGTTAGGATGSILNYGIIFDKSQDQDFLVIRPRVGTTTNRAIRITDAAFSTNKFEVWNDGTISTTGNINTTANIGAVQYFSSGSPGFSGTKVSGFCTFTITGGLITNVTGC